MIYENSLYIYTSSSDYYFFLYEVGDVSHASCAPVCIQHLSCHFDYFPRLACIISTGEKIIILCVSIIAKHSTLPYPKYQHQTIIIIKTLKLDL